MNVKPSLSERIWAALAHLSALAMGMGLFLPLIGWSENRHKSRYAAFQSLQALGYQTLGYTFWLIGIVIVSVIHLAALIVAASIFETLHADLIVWERIYFLIFLGLWGVYFVPPVLGAVACALGMDFRYPILGKRLARYLDYDLSRPSSESLWLNEDHEDRWVAAAGHFAVIIALWGLVVPIMAWVLQGKRSLFLKFQSVQTTVYQVGVSLFYAATGFFYVFGFVVLILTIDLEGNADSMIGVIVFFVSWLIATLIALLVPLLHILGQWAGYRVLKGHDYRYPFIGRLTEKWMSGRMLPAMTGGANSQEKL